eukprot:g11065.t1
MSAAATTIIPTGPAAGARTARRKQRCWLFQVDGVTTSAATEAELLASVRERYTTVKRLVVRPGKASERTTDAGRNVVVEVQFTGPQPSEGPGALLCDLLGGTSVEAKPVELPRGRKKRARIDASSEASDSDIEDGSSRKMGGHRSTNSLGRMSEEDEEESPGGGRVITAKPASGNGQGGSPMFGGKSQDPVVYRRTSSRESGGSVATPSSGLGPLSSAGIFKSPPSPESAVRTRAVVPTDDGNTRSTVFPSPQQHRTVSEESMQAPQKQQLEAMQQQQFSGSRPAAAAAGAEGGAGWDDVVGRMTTPQTSGHSLEMNSVDLNSNSSQAPVKPELDSLLQTSNNSMGTWASNDSQAALLGPMPPPQAVQPPMRGWSFDSAHQGGANNSGNMVVDLSDVNTLFHERDGNGAGPSGTTAASNATATRGSSADAGAGRQQQQDALSNAKWADEGPLPMEKVIIEPSRKECDFEGRPSPKSTPGNTPGNTRAPVSMPIDRQCHLVFEGLEKTGQDLSSLRVTAHFGVDAVHKVGKVTNPVQVGENGLAYAGVFYPSMQEIWPELYSTSNIRMVEVDLVVEIRSDSGEYQYVGPQLKVTYVRAAPPADALEQAPRPVGRRTASRAPIPYSNEPQVSYSCVDYSCGDWFSDMCQSVFRSGATSHQPLQEDPNDLMSVDP